MTHRVVLLASGSGTLAQAIIDAEELEIEIVALISDNPDAQALKRAQESSIQTFLLPMKDSRDEWNEGIIQTVVSLSADLVVSAGFMRILPPDFVNRFPTINSHPALLPQFPGAHAVRDALAAGVSVTGTTVHWVDDGVTQGRSLLKWRCQCCQEMMRPHFMRELRKLNAVSSLRPSP
jgi:phosphoribosylglycinamide formyltransferase 1